VSTGRSGVPWLCGRPCTRVTHSAGLGRPWLLRLCRPVSAHTASLKPTARPATCRLAALGQQPTRGRYCLHRGLDTQTHALHHRPLHSVAGPHKEKLPITLVGHPAGLRMRSDGAGARAADSGHSQAPQAASVALELCENTSLILYGGTNTADWGFIIRYQDDGA
jgi:hypothetical protein